MVAYTILNLLKPDELLMPAEGLNIFRVVVPPSYVAKFPAESQIRTQTGCNVIAVCDREATCVNIGPAHRFSENKELILIGSGEAESRFFKLHSEMCKIRASSAGVYPYCGAFSYSTLENLVLRARSELIGCAIIERDGVL